MLPSKLKATLPNLTISKFRAFAGWAPNASLLDAVPVGGGTATKIKLPAGALHYAGEWGRLSYDHQLGILYISDEDPTANTVANPTIARHIIELQMMADGKSG
jgi:hypothetical protein